MPRFLGIDFGLKRIGIAVSDDKGEFAFPFFVLANDKKSVVKIAGIVKEKNVEKIVLGLPLNLDNTPNPVVKDVEKFKEQLEKKAGVPVDFENEAFTTKEAERIQGKHDKIDASAAALILKIYLRKLAK